MSLARALIEAEAGGTLVLHKEDRSTDFLKVIYEGYGYPVMNGDFTQQELTAAIKSHSRIFGLGHGSPSGLFANRFMIDDRFGPLLAEKKDGLYIWCNADAYAHRNKLTGLVSGMFISEVGEAAMFGIKATQEEVDASNYAFSRAVRSYLDTGSDPQAVRQCYTSASCKITQFNSERLYVFDNGAPSPELHSTSMARPRPSWYDQQDTGSGYARARYLEPRPGDFGPGLEWGEDEWLDAFAEIVTNEGGDPYNIDEETYHQLLTDFDAGLSPEEAALKFRRA